MNNNDEQKIDVRWETLAVMCFCYVHDDIDVERFERLLIDDLGIQAHYLEDGVFEVTADSLCGNSAIDGDESYYEHLTKQFKQGTDAILKLQKFLHKTDSKGGTCGNKN
jgi:hypothetical protein